MGWRYSGGNLVREWECCALGCWGAAEVFGGKSLDALFYSGARVLGWGWVLTRKIHFGTHTYDLVSDVGNPFWGRPELMTLRVV